MAVLSDALPVHARWSEVNREFLEFVERNPACLDRASFASLSQDPSLRKFSIQPWPLFVGSGPLREMGEVALGMDRLVKGVIQRFLRNDPKTISQYYRTTDDPDGLSPMMVMLLAAEPNGIVAAPSRADYIETADGLRMIEYNAGGVLGGLQSDAVGRLHLASAPTARFLRERDRRVRAPEVLPLLFRHVVEDTVRLGAWREGDFTLAMVVRPIDPDRLAMHSVEAYTRLLRQALEACGVAAEGRVLLCGYDELVEERGFITLEGHRVNVVLEQHDGTGDVRAVFRVFKSGRVNLFSGPITWLLNDKRNLVLLSEHAGSADFTAAERALIERHLPWTRRVLPGSTTFRGRTLRIPEDLVDHREEMVLKKASSIGGAFVVVGRYRAPDQWTAAVGRAVRDGDWVVQEYLESVPYCFQSGSAAVRHDMVWGLFAFGNRFGGAFLRLAPAGQADGRVNGQQGAEIGAVLEVGG
jgi:hypothetical protein